MTFAQAEESSAANWMWEELKSKLLDADEIWIFSSREALWGRLCGRAGYAVRRGGEIVGTVLTAMSSDCKKFTMSKSARQQTTRPFRAVTISPPSLADRPFPAHSHQGVASLRAVTVSIRAFVAPVTSIETRSGRSVRSSHSSCHTAS